MRPSRIKGALNSFDRDGLSPAHYGERPAPVVAVAVAEPALPCVRVRRGDFHLFVRLSEREVRPVEDVISEWMADCANLIRQRDFAEAYGDALFDETPTATTPAMEAAARACDYRESRRTAEDDAGFIAPAE